MSPDQSFKLEQKTSDRRYRLILSGELDLSGAPTLEDAIRRLCLAGALEIEIDLRNLTTIDSAGINALIKAQRACANHHAEFFLIPSEDEWQRRLLELTGVLDGQPWRGT
jgi:anti-anti-sigma factor